MNSSATYAAPPDTFKEYKPSKCPTCHRSLKDRSSRQNSYMWSVVYQMIADEMGDSPEAIHRLMKEMHLPRMFVTVGDQEREEEKTTTLLTTSQMESYLSRVREWAAKELGLFVPLPNEYR